jgi:hypothetical protein
MKQIDLATENFNRTIFNLVRRRLIERCDSLQRFREHWKGRASGIEGWFRVEFVAAIGPAVATVHSGGAGGWVEKGCSAPTLF